MVLSNLSPFVGTAAAEEVEAQSDQLLLDRASAWKYLDDGIKEWIGRKKILMIAHGKRELHH